MRRQQAEELRPSRTPRRAGSRGTARAARVLPWPTTLPITMSAPSRQRRRVHALERVALEPVVVVDEVDELAARQVHAEVARPARPARVRDALDAHVRVLGRERVQPRRRRRRSSRRRRRSARARPAASSGRAASRGSRRRPRPGLKTGTITLTEGCRLGKVDILRRLYREYATAPGGSAEPSRLAACCDRVLRGEWRSARAEAVGRRGASAPREPQPSACARRAARRRPPPRARPRPPRRGRRARRRTACRGPRAARSASASAWRGSPAARRRRRRRSARAATCRPPPARAGCGRRASSGRRSSTISMSSPRARARDTAS